MKRRVVVIPVLLLLTSLLSPSSSASANRYGTESGKLAPTTGGPTTTKCEIAFTLKGWSAFYKTATGTGTITCDNGQKANVKLEAKGGGLTAGKSRINDGHGTFSAVADIRELLGTYVAASAAAGTGRSAEANVMTKGEVTLALTGKGTGFEVGVSFGKLTISKK